MARTPLFDLLKRSARRVALGREGWERWLEQQETLRTGRRGFLKAGALAVGGLALAGVLGGCGSRKRRPVDPFEGLPPISHQARIAIVGAGMSGLACAHRLRKSGLAATVYEAAARPGGRMYSARDLLAPDVVSELGGEFIDGSHEDLLAFVREYDLGLIDTRESTESSLRRDCLHFAGELRTEDDLLAELEAFAEPLRRDQARLADADIDWRTRDAAAREFDRMSLESYFDRIGLAGWSRAMLEATFRAEFGLEPGDQSALNLLAELDLDGESEGVLGSSDPDFERYKVQGGNQQIPHAIARSMREQLEFRRMLRRVAPGTAGDYILTFETDSGSMQEVVADLVVITVPFPVLREVELAIEMRPEKRTAIMELGMGTNSKLFLGYENRHWRALGFDGGFFSDLGVQSGWDSSRQQPTNRGAITSYLGGLAGERQVADTRGEAAAAAADLERLWPGSQALYSARFGKFHWPSFPLSKGSYSCYKPGQWTSIRGLEFEPVDNIYFAGEHCSAEFSGYMNGAAETGRRVAESIVARVMPAG